MPKLSDGAKMTQQSGTAGALQCEIAGMETPKHP
ncbi:hypothetical protein P3T32_003526 [Ralstonia sp. GP73]|jgi:hypothetical protein|uniref:Uncharacterized protein n=1 Tax=Ralstonia pickettii (strain 12J) TaxID=402626 RepID=B2U9A8_RALPJ|nr:hypothetical protein [Ralstonia sp. GP73]